MTSYILRFKYPNGSHKDYGMQFESEIPKKETLIFIESFLSANGYSKILGLDNTWENKNEFSICVVIQE